MSRAALEAALEQYEIDRMELKFVDAVRAHLAETPTQGHRERAHRLLESWARSSHSDEVDALGDLAAEFAAVEARGRAEEREACRRECLDIGAEDCGAAIRARSAK